MNYTDLIHSFIKITLPLSPLRNALLRDIRRHDIQRVLRHNNEFGLHLPNLRNRAGVFILALYKELLTIIAHTNQNLTV